MGIALQTELIEKKVRREFGLSQCSYYLLHSLHDLSLNPHNRITFKSLTAPLLTYKKNTIISEIKILCVGDYIRVFIPSRKGFRGALSASARTYSMGKRGYEVIARYNVLMYGEDGLSGPTVERPTVPDHTPAIPPDKQRQYILKLIRKAE